MGMMRLDVIENSESGEVRAVITHGGGLSLVIATISAGVRRDAPAIFEKWCDLMDEVVEDVIRRAGGTMNRTVEIRVDPPAG